MRKKSAPPSYIVLGTSAGGTSALLRIFKDLPADLPAAILIVMHVSDKALKNWLPDRLTGAGRMPVKIAEDGERIRQSFAYVAPAGTHLLVDGPCLRLGSGPREQSVRPAIDVLFRSAASTFGQRIIGVILTGMLRDGTAGLRAVRDAGGITIVQNPANAEMGDMPRNAMRGLGVDYCLDLADIAPLLELLVRRAGSYKRGVLETGLASSLRLMKDRVRLLARLYEQSKANPRTMGFLEAEIVALENDIGRITRMIPRQQSKSRLS